MHCPCTLAILTKLRSPRETFCCKYLNNFKNIIYIYTYTGTRYIVYISKNFPQKSLSDIINTLKIKKKDLVFSKNKKKVTILNFLYQRCLHFKLALAGTLSIARDKYVKSLLA